jgi:FMN phosphatase YigB (HAD superfamily)
MVEVVLFDLGDTLVGGSRPFPHVLEALSAIRQLKTASGAPIDCALVSDFTLAVPPTAARVKAIVSEYLDLLDGFGLRRFFDPAERCVTLSTHAGVMKPDRRVYELALTRLGGGARLTDCLSVTENAAHIAACRDLGMATLQFGADFTDWARFVPLVRNLLDPTDVHNV